MGAYSHDRLDPAPGATAQASALSPGIETFGVAAAGEAPVGGGRLDLEDPQWQERSRGSVR